MKYYCYLFLFAIIFSVNLKAVTADELMHVHQVTTTEMNNIASPQAGSVVYNTTESTLYFYTGSAWKRLRSIGSETIVQAGNSITVTGNGTNSTPYTIGTN